MSQELIYTSVPRGLKPGSKGFCTVAMSANMPTALVERLESLSGYRPVFPLGDPSADRNPVNWSHWRVTVGGKPHSVLSRVAFAGVDYTQRSNKFAHHLVLEPGEQSPAGPSWMMLQPGVMQSAWPHEPQTLSTRTLPDGDAIVRPCAAWAAITGDAGWGGVLAESYRSHPDKPFYILYAPGTDLLPLIEESLSLLPPALRWQVTFSTYFTELPIGLSCAWRFAVAGSKAATEAVRMGAAIVDLTRPLSAPPASRLVNAARSGDLPGEDQTDEVAAVVTARAGQRDEPIRITEPREAGTGVTDSPLRSRKRLGTEHLTLLEEPASEDEMDVYSPKFSKPHATHRGMSVIAAALLAAGCLLCGVLLGYGFASLHDLRPVAVADRTIPPVESSTRSSSNADDSPPKPSTLQPIAIAQPAPANIASDATGSGVRTGDLSHEPREKPSTEPALLSPVHDKAADPALPLRQRDVPPIAVPPIMGVLANEVIKSTLEANTERYVYGTTSDFAAVVTMSLELPNKRDKCGIVLLHPSDNHKTIVLYSEATSSESTIATIEVASGKIDIRWKIPDRSQAHPILLASELIVHRKEAADLKLRFQNIQHIDILRDALNSGYRIPLPNDQVTSDLKRCLVLWPSFKNWRDRPLQYPKERMQEITYEAPGWPDITFIETLDLDSLRVSCAMGNAFRLLKSKSDSVTTAITTLENHNQISTEVDAIAHTLTQDRSGAITEYQSQWTEYSKADAAVSKATKNDEKKRTGDAVKAELDRLEKLADALLGPLRRELETLNTLKSELKQFSIVLVYQNGVPVCELHVK